jgi:hypothetical protein
VPITFEIDKPRGQIRTTVVGSVTVDDIRTHAEALVRENALGYADLIDARAASGPGLFSGDIRRIAEMVGTLRGDFAMGPRAIVVSSNSAYGMVRMLAALASAWTTIEVFRDWNSAEQWLAGSALGPTA